MSLNSNAIKAASAAALAAIENAADLEALKQVKIDHIGDRSELAKANQTLGKLDPAQRADFGKIIGMARAEVNAAFTARETQLQIERDARILEEERVDVTLPGRRTQKGGLHPLTILTNEISDLFWVLGIQLPKVLSSNLNGSILMPSICL